MPASVIKPRSSPQWPLRHPSKNARTDGGHEVVQPLDLPGAQLDVVCGGRSRASRGKLNRFRVRIPLRQFSATPSKFPTFLHVAARGLGPPCGPYMPLGLRAGFRLDAMIRHASRRWLSSASSAI